MDRLAADGVTFTHAFVASPSCAPSRSALLTGLMPARNGSEANHSKPRAEIKKLPAYLRELGYEVVGFGKVAHYKHGEFFGFDRIEFDTFHDYRGIPAAVEFLSKRAAPEAKPLCLIVGTNWPHTPWPKEPDGYDEQSLVPPESHVDTPATRAARARYYTAVTKADHDLGVIYDAARAHLGANTLFLHTSDHGAQWPFGKWTCYDDGIRVPLIAAWPKVIKAGTRTDAMVSWIDLLPTFIAAAGGQPPAELDGRSFLKVLRAEKNEHRERIFATHSGDGKMNVYPSRTVRTRDWKLIRNLHPEFVFTTHVDKGKPVDGVSYWSSWLRKAQKDLGAAAIVQRYQERPAQELYDLRNDPLERNNLAALPEQAERLKSMNEELDAWMKEQGDQGTVFGPPTLLKK